MYHTNDTPEDTKELQTFVELLANLRLPVKVFRPEVSLCSITMGVEIRDNQYWMSQGLDEFQFALSDVDSFDTSLTGLYISFDKD